MIGHGKSDQEKKSMDLETFARLAGKTKLQEKALDLARLRLVAGLLYCQISKQTGAPRELIRRAENRILLELRREGQKW